MTPKTDSAAVLRELRIGVELDAHLDPLGPAKLEAIDAAIAALSARGEEEYTAQDALQSLMLWLSVGGAHGDVNPRTAEERIRWGVDHIIAGEVNRARRMFHLTNPAPGGVVDAVTEDDISRIEFAVENMRLADPSEEQIEARWNLAYKLGEIAKKLRAALASRTGKGEA